MIFSSPGFLVFLLATLALYGCARNTQQRAGVMLAASLVFYASWRPSYLLLLLASLTINHHLYLRLVALRSRRVLVTAVVLNLALLGTAKYLAFLTESLLPVLAALGWNAGRAAPEWMHWALPLGISFYTFHMLSAMFDAWRGTWARPVGFARWCLYVTFFPHLIAGPILRPGQLIDQLGDLTPVSGRNLRLGGAIFVAGLLKKTLLADNLAPLADAAYSHPAGLDAAGAWLGTLAFAFQIYFDFSGYSEMAIGLACMFGVELPRNFIHPYLSRSPSEFWRRWHITLSQWLRDYLYITLGGSHGTPVRTAFNLMATMVLGGLWHGASWTFVAWGGLHGMYLIGQRLLAAGVARAGLPVGLQQQLSLAGIPLTFVLVLVSWVFFRAADFQGAWTVLSAMAGFHEPQQPAFRLRLYEMGIVALAATVAFGEPWLERLARPLGSTWWWQMPSWLRGTAYAGLTLTVIAFGGPVQKFVYFDF